MIFAALFSFFATFFGFALSWLPNVTVLPFGIDQYMVDGFGYIRFIATVFPPMGILLQGFIYVLAWKFMLLGIRMIPIVRNMFINK